MKRPDPLRILNAIHPDHATFHRLTFWPDGTVTIERPWCCLILRRELEALTERPDLHKWLIGRLEENIVTI